MIYQSTAKQQGWRRFWPFWRDIVKAVVVVAIFLLGVGVYRVMHQYLTTYDIFLGFLERDLSELVEEWEKKNEPE